MGSLRWAGFEAAASELAAQRRALIECFGFVLAGTIRADGTPRISPVAAHLVSGNLMLVMIPGTQKAREVLRDSRVVLQSPVTEAAEPCAEFKLRGHAVWRSGPRAGTAGRSPCRPRPAPPGPLPPPGRRVARANPRRGRAGLDVRVVPAPGSSVRWLVRDEYQDVTVAGRVCVRVAAFDPDAVEPRLLEHHEQLVAEVEGFLEDLVLVGFQVP